MVEAMGMSAEKPFEDFTVIPLTKDNIEEVLSALPRVELTEADVSDLDPAALLAGLYNASKPQGKGLLWFVPGDMTVERARAVLGEHGLNFDYLEGRVMKVKLGRRKLETQLYNRDNGEGAAERVIAQVRAEKEASK